MLIFWLGSVNVVDAREKPAKNFEQAYQEELQKLTDEAGTYPIELFYDQNGTMMKKTVYATVKGEHTKIEGNVGIDAQSFNVGLDQIGKLQQKDWVQLAKAKAWQTTDGTTISIVNVDDTKVTQKVGAYPITFYTVNQVATTVTVNVMATEKMQTIVDFEKNEKTGWSEWMTDEGQLQWANYENIFNVVVKVGLVFLLFIPIFILLFQYFLASRLVEQVIKMFI